MQPISSQELKDACADLHSKAENTKLAQEMLAGTVDPLLYKNLCYQLYLITDVIETKVKLPEHLERRALLVQDIASGPGCSVKACPSTLEYIQHLRSHFNPHIHGQLNGHIYVHYLGWLYGGQIMSKKMPFLPRKHLDFVDPRASIDYIRKSILALTWDRDIDAARMAFSYTIRIYDELYQLH